MERYKKIIRNNSGQILIEAVVASALMILLMLAFAKLVELKKSQTKKPFQKIYSHIEELNKTVKN